MPVLPDDPIAAAARCLAPRSTEKPGEREPAPALNADTLQALAGPPPTSPRLPPAWNDLPVSRLMATTLRPGIARGPIGHLPTRPDDPDRWLQHAFWCAYVAPTAHNWPEPLAEPLRRYLATPLGCVLPGLPLTRGMLLLHALRDDLQASFDLGDARSRAAYLHWLCSRGLAELDLPLHAFDARLPVWLALTSRRLADIPVVLELVWLTRPDLQAAFDVATPAGRSDLRQWAMAHYTAAYADTPMAALHPAAMPTRTNQLARSADLPHLLGHVP